MPPHSQNKRSAAYLDSIRYYLDGSWEADAISECILSHLKPVESSTRLRGFGDEPLADRYSYDLAGIKGELVRRVDGEGRILFVVYRGREPPVFLTEPDVWAHLDGYQGQRIRIRKAGGGRGRYRGIRGPAEGVPSQQEI